MEIANGFSLNILINQLIYYQNNYYLRIISFSVL